MAIYDGYLTLCMNCGHEDDNGSYDRPCIHCGEYECESQEPIEACICTGDHCYC